MLPPQRLPDFHERLQHSVLRLIQHLDEVLLVVPRIKRSPAAITLLPT
jgi:hypothetical protein